MDAASLGSGLLTGVVGLLGVWVGVWLTQSNERRRWLLELKLTAITGFVEDTSLMFDRFRMTEGASGRELAEWQHAVQSGRTAIHLLCTRETIDAAERLAKNALRAHEDRSEEHQAATITSLKEFVATARRELDDAGGLTARLRDRVARNA